MQVIINKYRDMTEDQMESYLGKVRLGNVFYKEGSIEFEDKCHYCGKWVIYNDDGKRAMIREGRWDMHNNRMLYCGGSTCTDFVHKQRYFEGKRQEEEKVSDERRWNKIKHIFN